MSQMLHDPIQIFEDSDLTIGTKADGTEVLFNPSTRFRLLGFAHGDPQGLSPDHTLRIAHPGDRFTVALTPGFRSKALDHMAALLPESGPIPELRDSDLEDTRKNSSDTGDGGRIYASRALAKMLNRGSSGADILQGFRALRSYVGDQCKRPLSHVSTSPTGPRFWMTGDAYSAKEFLNSGWTTGQKAETGYDACDTAHAHYENELALAAIGDDLGRAIVALKYRIQCAIKGRTNFATQGRGAGWMAKFHSICALMPFTREFLDAYCGGVAPIDVVRWIADLTKPGGRWWTEIYPKQWTTNLGQGLSANATWTLADDEIAGRYELNFHNAIWLRGISEAAVATASIDPRLSAQLATNAQEMVLWLLSPKNPGRPVDPETGTFSWVSGPVRMTGEELERALQDGNDHERGNPVVASGSGSWREERRDRDAALFAGAFAVVELDDSATANTSAFLAAYRSRVGGSLDQFHYDAAAGSAVLGEVL